MIGSTNVAPRPVSSVGSAAVPPDPPPEQPAAADTSNKAGRSRGAVMGGLRRGGWRGRAPASYQGGLMRQRRRCEGLVKGNYSFSPLPLRERGRGEGERDCGVRSVSPSPRGL